MDICRAYQIPHGAFLSWSDDDQDKAVAHELYKRTTCSQCGTEESAWITRDENGVVHAIFPPPFQPEPYRCFGCEAVQKAQADVPPSEKGVYVRLAPPSEEVIEQ